MALRRDVMALRRDVMARLDRAIGREPAIEPEAHLAVDPGPGPRGWTASNDPRGNNPAAITLPPQKNPAKRHATPE